MLPARIDVDEGIDGEGEGVDEVVCDGLGDLVPLADREVGIHSGDQRDEHTVTVPAHPYMIDGGNTID